MINFGKEQQRFIHYLEGTIYCYENGIGRKPVNSITQKMSDIWARQRYEISKVQLEAFNKYEDALMRIRRTNPFTIAYYTQADIRMRAAAQASCGRTLKVTDLTKDELIKAREIANKLVDEHIEKYRAEVL